MRGCFVSTIDSRGHKDIKDKAHERCVQLGV